MQLTREIETMLEDDLSRGRQLLALLEQETLAVKKRNYALLEQLLNEKTPLMAQLKTNALKREAWLASVKKTHKDADWHFILKQIKLEHLAGKWEEAKVIMTQCQDVNTTNGQLIHRGLKCNKRILNILQGNIEDEKLYNAKGLQGNQSKAIAAYACA